MARYEIKQRPARVRETAARDGAEAPEPVTFSVTIAERGRVVLPVDVRERLNIKEGDRLAGRLEADGTISLQTPAAFARSLRGMFKHLARPGRSVVDELIAERRREAAMEERQDRGVAARRKAKARR